MHPDYFTQKRKVFESLVFQV